MKDLTFGSILGNDRLVKNLKDSILNNRVSHAYIIKGSRGTGKTLAANIFAKALECEENTGTPCNRCTSCRIFESKNHPDIIYVYPEKTKTLGINDIRNQVIKNVNIKQYKYKYKIFIIPNADKMTVEAQNAFLKTLEEPPSYAVFLLLAENTQGFLPTILSRCVILRTKEVAEKTIKSYLTENQSIDESKAQFISEYAKGSIGEAIKLSTSEDFSVMRENITNLLYGLKKMSLSDFFVQVKSLDIYKENEEFLDIVYLWYKDLYAAKFFEDAKYITQKDKYEKIMIAAESETLESIEKKLDAIWQSKKMILAKVNFMYVIESLFINLKEI